MTIGQRIKKARLHKGLTQQELGVLIGFPINSADVRIAQYESGARTPKEKFLTDIANALDVSPQALDLPDIDSYAGLAHTLFALEDLYGFKISNIDGELCLTLDKSKGMTYVSMFDIFNAWSKEYAKLQNGEIIEEEYNAWRYNYQKAEAERTRATLNNLRQKRKGER